jgi:hypothetical protein
LELRFIDELDNHHKGRRLRRAHQSHTTGPVIIWLRIGNATNLVLLGWLTPRWEEVMDHINAGDRLIEVR